jgi:hypothetical protein
MSVADVAGGKAMQMQEAFEKFFMRHLGPEDAAMLGDMDVMSNDYFFSPGAAAIAMPVIRAYGGIECEAPKRSTVALLVTNHGARRVPFAPEK